MPTKKHKRKASAHSQAKTTNRAEAPGLITTHPKLFVLFGALFVALGAYLLAFESQDNSMFGLAMLSLIAGVVIIIYANFAAPKKKNRSR